MQPIALRNRCRGIRAGWNRQCILDYLRRQEWISKSPKLLILTVFLSILVLRFPISTPFGFSDEELPVIIETDAGAADMLALGADPAIRTSVHTIDVFLKRYQVSESHRDRVAKSIVSSARKYDVDPKLVASISMVESRGNPFAISNRDSVGVMQIHLPTWGHTAYSEGINLFKIEENIDFGVRILKNYIRQFGLWEGVKRYKGWHPDSPESLQSVEEYLAKVQHVYGYEDPPTELLQ